MSQFLSDIQKKYFDSFQGQRVRFIMGIQDTFTIPGRSTVVTGVVATGAVQLKDIVEVISQDGSRFFVRVNGIEKDQKLLEFATQGEAIGILLQLNRAGIINVGDVLFKTDTII